MPNSTKKQVTKGTLRIPRIRKTGTAEDLQRRLWQVIEMCWTVIRSEKTTLEEKRQFGHLLSQTSGSYGKLVETIDLKGELEALRKELAELRTSEPMRKVA